MISSFFEYFFFSNISLFWLFFWANLFFWVLFWVVFWYFWSIRTYLVSPVSQGGGGFKCTLMEPLMDIFRVLIPKHHIHNRVYFRHLQPIHSLKIMYLGIICLLLTVLSCLQTHECPNWLLPGWMGPQQTDVRTFRRVCGSKWEELSFTSVYYIQL